MKRNIFYIGIVAIVLSGCSTDIAEEFKSMEEDQESLVKERSEDVYSSEEFSKTEELERRALRVFKEPLANATERMTKKPFGLFVTPKNSPVQPERFSGYHTGTDFEVTESERGVDIPVFAICTGFIESIRIVEGYGGVVVQSCTIDDEDIYVLYGHISLPETFVTAGSDVVAGEKISTLGKHESVETDGERKHLHLGIIRDDDIDLRGYVQSAEELVQWIDYEQLVLKR